MEVLANEPRIDPGRVLIDHCEEHTVGEVLDAGYWAGLTLYSDSKGSPQRAVDTIEMHGADRICINSSADSERERSTGDSQDRERNAATRAFGEADGTHVL